MASNGPRPLGWGPRELSGERGMNKQVKRKAPSELEMGRAVQTWMPRTVQCGLRMVRAEPLNGIGREKEPF